MVQPPESTKPKRFSMLREFSLADFITLANGLCGMGSILACLRFLVDGQAAFLWTAFALLPFAMAFDYLDGRVARWRRKMSPLGAHLDSLADLVSFGVAPAVLGFVVGLRGGWDAVILTYFVLCGLSRLARYNATMLDLADETGKVPYYEGTPIPTSLAVVLGLAVLTGLDRIGARLPFGDLELLGFTWHPVSLLFFVSGSAMISRRLRVPKP